MSSRIAGLALGSSLHQVLRRRQSQLASALPREGSQTDQSLVRWRPSERCRNRGRCRTSTCLGEVEASNIRFETCVRGRSECDGRVNLRKTEVFRRENKISSHLRARARPKNEWNRKC